MKKYGFNEITLMQYILIIHGIQVGIGVLTMPRDLAEKAGTDGWISILIGWGIAVAASLTIVNVMKRHPDGTLLDLVTNRFGKIAGKAMTIVMALYLILGFTTTIATAISITRVWILSQTPPSVILILFFIPGYIIARSGVRILGRYSELVFFLAAGSPFVLLATLPNAHWLHMLPVLKEGWLRVFVTARSTVLSFLGFELSFFLYPFLNRKERAGVGIVIANTLSMLVFVFVTVVCNLFFSPDEITEYTWPTLSLLKVIEFRFLERFDIVFLAFYLFIFSTTWLPLLLFAAFCTSQLTGREDHSLHLAFTIVVAIAVSWFYFPQFTHLVAMQNLWSIVGIIVAYGLPVLLWVIFGLFRRSGPGGETA
ncbi:GerAB/ArcD/ProY family transporter [Paenibacillus flagellatus]|uniref:Spore gernimation protein n=1 Tax=Paenibacillus flagellatus TaxID=2211139 RepID=A0A2V5KJT7_9BACL|nr:endospore germination permease [Paenibacillus flagellatus]PYI54930.1 spore gernimation protein [Paenibacillus flagellatus]